MPICQYAKMSMFKNVNIFILFKEKNIIKMKKNGLFLRERFVLRTHVVSFVLKFIIDDVFFFFVFYVWLRLLKGFIYK